MAELEQAPQVDQPGIDEILREILGGSGDAAEAQIEAARIGADAMLEQQRRGQEFLRESSGQAQSLYSPYVGGGQMWLQRYKDLYDQGAPQYQWDREFQYDPWQWDREFQYQQLPEYLQGRLSPDRMAQSPYYGLYQFQRQQQQSDIDRALRARGMYGSGAGMEQALAASTGMDQQFAADEYQRALQEYGVGYDQSKEKYLMDYEQALQGHNIGYEEARQKYGMDYDQYLKAFGIQQGQYQDRLAQAQQMGQYGWLGTQATANALLGSGSQMATGALQTGQTLAGLQSNLGSGLASTYNAQGNTLAGLYNAAQNRSLTQSLANQGQQNWNTANSANQALGMANLATGAGRSLWDAYRYYNTPSGGGIGGGGYGGGVDMSGYGNILDSAYNGSYGL